MAQRNALVNIGGTISELPAGDTLAGTSGSGGGGSSVLNLGVMPTTLTASTTTLIDATGVSFAVLAGKVYYFKFYALIDLQASAGGQVGITGPAFTLLDYRVDIGKQNSATAASGNRLFQDGINAYLTRMSVPSTSYSISNGNTNATAIIEGFIKPSADGTLKLQFACASGSAPVKMLAPYSHVQYIALT